MADDLGQVLLDRYRLTEPLGQGGMGTVWRAHDTRLGREVAVKQLRLPPDLGTEQRASWTARLDREARAAARLRHPGIVTVHDLVITEDGQPWIIMELVPGRSLADLLAREGTLAPDRAAALGLQILDALVAAHQAGIVHRDLKPANVLLEGERALLTDFGIAAVEGETALTRSGALLGTPAFMAPEQVRGQPATAATDLWALGATLYNAVEGRPPFAGTATGAVLVAIATEAPSPMRNAGPLQPVVEGLLHKDPAGRPDAAALRAALSRVASTRPDPVAEAPPTRPLPPHGPAASPPTPPSPGPGRPKRAVLIAVALLAVLVVAGTGLTFAMRRDSAYEANRKDAAAIGAPTGFTLKKEQKVDAGRVRRTYSGCPRFCGGSASDLGPTVQVVARWLTRVRSVSSVGQPVAQANGSVWTIAVATDTAPKISNVRVLAVGDPQRDVLLQLEVG
ncbi:serine/threonine-protein kinase [Actinomadura luteofluorescens]|uniref:serine/threonine-protein kinase n=1 Tax=Actinomadura luteofluorescens TaxID=46163 RepID=UPI002164753A|nr:serine/threonine-protein kinase [Actinomadura glauciflava]